MYSRNRSGAAEEKYSGNLPPLYSGNRFRPPREDAGIVVLDERSREVREVREEKPHDECPAQSGVDIIAAEAAAPCESDPSVEAAPTNPPHSLPSMLGNLFSAAQREDALLLVLLLLLSAEHEGGMDILIMLLLLFGIR